MYEKKFQIPLPDKGYEKSDTLNDFHKIRLFNQVELPFEYGFCTIKEYQLTTEKYKEEELKDILEKRFDEYLIKLDEKGVQILEKDVKIVSGYNTTSLRSNLTIIGKVQKGDF